MIIYHIIISFLSNTPQKSIDSSIGFQHATSPYIHTYHEASIGKRVLAINDTSHEMDQFLSQEREIKEENSRLNIPKRLLAL